jgi:ribosomal-protein-alanine N-acetyltransferase
MPFDVTALATERLRLRPLRATDADALFGIFSDSTVMRYWSSTAWTDARQASDYIAKAAEGLATGSMLRLGIELAATGELLGQAALYAFHQANRRCEIGYALGRAHWGKGYLGEALTALLDHGFGALNLHRVEADIDPGNTASAKALRRLGFEREGLLRERWIVGGEIADTEFYGLLKRDWDARRSR